MAANFKRIITNNGREIIDDIKDAVTVMVYASSTGQFFQITKKELYLQAEETKIRYMMTHKIFKNERLTFVVL